MTRFFVIIPVLILIRQTTSECVETFITVCDNVEDIYKSRIDVTFKDLIVQSKIPKSQDNLLCLPLDLLHNQLKYARRVTFVQQLNGFCGQPKCVQDVKIKYMTFYKNNLPHLNYWFLQCKKLKKLSLVSNKMKTVGNFAFRFAQIEEIDLSNNEIKIIRRDYGFNNFTKVLIFKNNKLTLVQPNTLPVAVEYLDLSHNEITGMLEAQVFDHLEELQFLYLSHNKIKVFPDLTKLTKLKILDISYNKIFSIDFTQSNKPSTTLELLNLSHNELTSFDFVLAFTCESEKTIALEIALHFNIVRETKIENVTVCNSTRNVFLSVFGNPWSCREINEFEEVMAKYGIKHSCCDGLFFNSGLIPFCIGETPYDIASDDINNFLDIITNRSNLVECNLSTTGACNLLS